MPDELKNFSGIAPLFPLPETVLFPHVVLPLHIFEPRYRKMVADALAGSRQIAMALLKPDWHATYESKLAPIHQTVCLGTITSEEELREGRFNILLRGLVRARILEEVSSTDPYRLAKLELLPDDYPAGGDHDRDETREQLLAAFFTVCPRLEDHPLFRGLQNSDVPVGELTDLLAHGARLSPVELQALLETTNVDERAEFLIRTLRERKRQEERVVRKFPPPFSRN